jgi:hypothetical protein
MGALSLSSIISNLTKSFSVAFWLAGVFPAFLFLFLNAGMLYWLNANFRQYAAAVWQESSAGQTAFVSAFCIVTLLVFAYLVVALSTRMRKILEGDWPRFLRGLREQFIALQSKRWLDLENRIEEAVVARSPEKGDSERWKEQLRFARVRGSRLYPNRRWRQNGLLFSELRKSRAKNQVITPATLQSAVWNLEGLLASWDADASPELDRAQQELLQLLDYSVNRAQEEHFRLANERHLNYGSVLLSATEMGNIAGSVQSYAVQRYNFNLELFWSSLQRCVQKDKEFFPVLQDAKTKLDFLVACSWLAGLFSGIWLLVLLVCVYDWRPFLAIGLLGPTLSFVFYRSAVEQYRAFSDALKTTIDLFRFDLLASFGLRMPEDVQDERDIWQRLNGLTAYGEEGNFRYQPRAAK